MIARVTCDGQPPALHGVGEYHTGALGFGVARGIRLEHGSDVVPAEVGDQLGELEVAQTRAVVEHRAGRAVEEALAQRGRVEPEERLVALVGHRVDPLLQLRHLLVCREQPRPVLDLHDMPSRSLELGLELVDPDARHDPVQRLAVEVDHPHDVAQPVGGRVGDGLPDVALVEFGVAHEHDEPAGWTRPEVRVDIAASRRSEQRCGSTEPDRARGEVDAIDVLGAGRIRLQPTAGAQRGELAAIEPAKQILDGVEGRRGVRLDADPVGGVQVREPQRRHRGDQARTGGLMPTDFEPVGVDPIMVGVVDDPGRQPQHSLRDLVEQLGSGGCVPWGVWRHTGQFDHNRW